jgi:hypothetical protein
MISAMKWIWEVSHSVWIVGDTDRDLASLTVPPAARCN